MNYDIAGFRPGGRFTFLSGKVNKTIDAQFGNHKMDRTQDSKADQLAVLRQGPQDIRASDPKTELQAADWGNHSLTEEVGMICWKPWLGSLVMMFGLSLTVAGTVVQAQSGSLEPPGSAVNGSGDPVATTQTQPSWDQVLSPNERFKLVMGGEAVLDKETGLVWERSPSTTERAWQSARFFCAANTVGDRRGWRLPSLHELASLIDPTNPGGNPDLPVGHPFSNVQSSLYWTSALSDVGGSTTAVSLDFEEFTVALGSTVFADNFFWCVRGGSRCQNTNREWLVASYEMMSEINGGS